MSRAKTTLIGIVLSVILALLFLGALSRSFRTLLISLVLIASIGVLYAIWYAVGGGREYRKAHKELRAVCCSLGVKEDQGRVFFSLEGENILISVVTRRLFTESYVIERLELEGNRRAERFTSHGIWEEVLLAFYGEGIALREGAFQQPPTKHFTEIFTEPASITRRWASIETISLLASQMRRCAPI